MRGFFLQAFQTFQSDFGFFFLLQSFGLTAALFGNDCGRRPFDKIGIAQFGCVPFKVFIQLGQRFFKTGFFSRDINYAFNIQINIFVLFYMVWNIHIIVFVFFGFFQSESFYSMLCKNWLCDFCSKFI